MSMIACCVSQEISAPARRFRILPAGLFRAKDGRPQGLAGWMMDAAAAQRVIESVNRMQGDLVIDYEHATLSAKKNANASPAAGWFKSLQWVEGSGLYVADARWTDRASKMITDKEYRYVSPVFAFDVSGMVIGLHSLALTNDPALDGLTDLAVATAQIGMTPPAGMSAHDHAVMQQIFGENYAGAFAQVEAEKQAALSASIPPQGIGSADHHTFQHVFGGDYHKHQ